MGECPNRANWNFNIFSKDKYPSKEEIIEMYVRQILIRTQEIFQYKNLPKTIPAKDLEFILQTNGKAGFAKAPDGELYAFRVGLGGKPNPYYLPTLAIFANPALNFTAQLEIDKECVVMLNDPCYEGLLPLIKHNAILLAECDISFKFAAINSRSPILGVATDDNTKESFNIFYDDLIEGKKVGIIVDENFGDENSFKAADYSYKNNAVKDLIELKQYIKGSFLQDLGINSQFNMKREAINEAEASLSDDILFPTIDQMLEQRKIGIEKINNMFGTDISVELKSVWRDLREEDKIAKEKQEAEVEQIKSEAENNEVEEVTEDEQNS